MSDIDRDALIRGRCCSARTLRRTENGFGKRRASITTWNSQTRKRGST